MENKRQTKKKLKIISSSTSSVERKHQTKQQRKTKKAQPKVRMIIDSSTTSSSPEIIIRGKIKEKIVEIIRDINLNRFHTNKFKIPYHVTVDYIKELFENKPKVHIKKIHNEPSVGLINGLYATTSGLGGITPIQVVKFPASKMLELNITGKAGEVMKESIEYSLKNAFALLSKKLQDKIIKGL